MKILLFFPAILFVGCATVPTHEQKLSMAGRLSNAEICYIDAVGYQDDAVFVKPEIAKRELVCTRDLIALGETIHQARKPRSVGIVLPAPTISAPYVPPPIALPPPPVNCVTWRLANGVTTTNCQ